MMKRYLNFIDNKFLPLFAIPANIALFVMMMITMIDIAGRTFFGKPIMGSIEVTQISLAIMIVCAFPLLIRDEAHISVDLLDNFIPRWIVPWRQLIIHLIATIALLFLSWQVYRYADRAFQYGDVTEFLRMPRGIIFGIIAFMGIVSAISSLVKVIYYLGIIIRIQPAQTDIDFSKVEDKQHD